MFSLSPGLAIVLSTVGLIASNGNSVVAFGAGVTITVGFGLTAYLIIQITGTGPTLAGMEAEVMTSDDLKRLRRAGWLTEDHIPFEFNDIDHIVVGPDMAFALETKWTANDWTQANPYDDRIDRACRQARDAARKLRLFLRAEAGLRVEVEPVVVLQGRVADDEFEVPTVIDGVTVLRGAHVKSWAADLGQIDPLRRIELVQAQKLIEAWLNRRDAHVASAVVDTAWYVRHGIGRPLEGLAFGTAAALTTVWAGSSLLVLDVWWFWARAGFVGVAALATSGFTIAKSRRPIVLGIAVGAWVVVLLVIASLIRAAF